jgi:hypothetical protein
MKRSTQRLGGHDGGQGELILELAALQRAVEGTRTLKDILDGRWFETIESAIRQLPSSSAVLADPSGFLSDFRHPLRGVPWFEEAQRLYLAGRLGDVSEDDGDALGFVGVDPLRTAVPSLDDRLSAFRALAFKPDVVEVKLAELRASRSTSSFRNHLFELSVLGDLALRGVLVDIEEAATSVDGVARIEHRDILIEATNTTQHVIPDRVGVFCTDPNLEIDHVVYKLRKKVADGRQLALANGRPAVLFLARTYLGACRESAQIALTECFASTDFAGLSGVVLADSWKLHVTSWYPGLKPEVPLTDGEASALASWYGRT